MRVLKKHLTGGGVSGSITLLAEEDEDLWHAYNLISVGDTITGGTFRKITRESSSGSTSTERKAITLSIQVEGMDYDVEGGSLRVKGPCVSQNRFVPMGSYHSIELAVDRKFTVEKAAWDAVSKERLKAATDVRCATRYHRDSPTLTPPPHALTQLAGSADLAALLLSSGSATLVLLKGELSIVRAQIDVNIPKRRSGGSGHDKAQKKFLDSIIAALLQYVDFDKVKAVLLASPGFVREEVHAYIFEEAARQGLAALLHNKSKFLQVHTSGGGTQALSEALAEPSVAKLLQDTKAAAQVMALKRFFELLHTDAERAMYGHRFVAYSVERGAVETLLIADDQFRAADLAQRAANIRLSEDTQAAGGKVHVFSTQHASGQQLGELGGVAAILRFPLPEAEDALLATAVAEDEDVSSDEEELYARLSLEMSANKAAGTAAPASAGAGSAAR